MICCGDLQDDEEYINQVVCDFLLFIAEGILDVRFTSDFPIQYDDVMIILFYIFYSRSSNQTIFLQAYIVS
mgnify:CR=1 FL=1